MQKKSTLREEKDIIWLGLSFDDLMAFPANARKDVGYQLHQIQCGLEPED